MIVGVSDALSDELYMTVAECDRSPAVMDVCNGAVEGCISVRFPLDKPTHSPECPTCAEAVCEENGICRVINRRKGAAVHTLRRILYIYAVTGLVIAIIGIGLTPPPL